MPPAETRLQLAVFTLLAAGTAANLLAFQEKRRGANIETSAISGMGQAESRTAANVVGPVAAAQPKFAAASQQPAETNVSKAEIIRGVQRELNTRGYGTGQPDGVAGLLTRASIMAYEYDYGLALTAEPTQEFLSRIVLGTSGPAAHLKGQPQVKTAEAEAVVKAVRQFLSGLGYIAGKADGKLTEDMIRAIRDFELDQKLPETGRISGQLVSRLLHVQGQSQGQGQGKVANGAKG
jgi:peptidoglycan hydrolase-like protein with peptidoglycan-binding domain